jgi:hypothetical protein
LPGTAPSRSNKANSQAVIEVKRQCGGLRERKRPFGLRPTIRSSTRLKFWHFVPWRRIEPGVKTLRHPA